MSEPGTLLEFPCAFPIKAMGRNSGEFQSVVTEIVSRHAQLFNGEQVRTRASGVGNFLSVTITVSAESREQLDRIYQDLTDCKQVLMAL
jgi:putative lipoic acid-binding regulatory protein